MLKVFVEDNDESGEVSVTFTFDGRMPDGLLEASILLQASRPMAPAGTRLDVELGAHTAYFQEFERGLRQLAIPFDTSDEKQWQP